MGCGCGGSTQKPKPPAPAKGQDREAAPASSLPATRTPGYYSGPKGSKAK